MYVTKTAPEKQPYLRPLINIPNPPKQLFYRGELPAERAPTVAVVGTRKPTAYGREVGHKITYDLVKRGVIVVSGLALGTDAIAHRAALEAGGITLAVLANSVDSVYPRSHKALGEQIVASGGAIISEYEPPTEARAHYFLARNRIVSGLSDAVIIIEAAQRSGTLSTAAHALEQGKEVFVVPGNITSPLSAGCNALLKQGAHPITCAEDVLEVIAPELLKAQAVLPLGATPLESKIIALLQQGIRDGDQLQQHSGAQPHEFSQAVTMMEITGSIRALGANQWTLGN